MNTVKWIVAFVGGIGIMSAIHTSQMNTVRMQRTDEVKFRCFERVLYHTNWQVGGTNYFWSPTVRTNVPAGVVHSWNLDDTFVLHFQEPISNNLGKEWWNVDFMSYFPYTWIDRSNNR